MAFKSRSMATLKERRQVADLLAIKDGSETRQPQHIEAAANMSDQEIKQYLRDNAPAVEVDEIKPGELPADLFGICNGLIIEFCTKFDIDKNNIAPLQWGAACSYVGQWFKSKNMFVTDSPNSIMSNCKKINASAAAEVLPVWANLCGVYNKVPLQHDFANFCGLSWDWLYRLEHNAQGVTADDINLYKRVREICRGGLDSRLIDGKQAPVGAIFYAKAKEGYQETQTIRHEYGKSDNNAAALPVFGDFNAIESEKS